MPVRLIQFEIKASTGNESNGGDDNEEEEDDKGDGNKKEEEVVTGPKQHMCKDERRGVFR